MILIRIEADFPTVGARKDLSLLHLALPALPAGVLGDQLQLSLTARRARFGDLPTIPGQRAPIPALWATVGRLGEGLEGSADKAYPVALAVEAELLGLFSPIHSLTPSLFSL